jgi:hypothetical protein
VLHAQAKRARHQWRAFAGDGEIYSAAAVYDTNDGALKSMRAVPAALTYPKTSWHQESLGSVLGDESFGFRLVLRPDGPTGFAIAFRAGRVISFIRVHGPSEFQLALELAKKMGEKIR